MLNGKLLGREIVLKLDDVLRDKIRQTGFDDKYGARPLKNAFNRLVIKPFSKILLAEPNLQGNFRLVEDDQQRLKIEPES
jgi:ATP-dependent Clp protease ATP-binding subunit ClpA